jgi:acetylornithine deacetylase/succinyl-diaminopimelate desuccinylase-like protein
VDSISSKQVKNNKSILKDKESVFEMTGAKAFLMEKGLDFYTQIGLRPTIQVTGFKAGYISEGYANIVPATAEVRLNFRIVTSQKSKDVIKAFETFSSSSSPIIINASFMTSPQFRF